MRLIHFLTAHWEPPFTGVNRFARDLRRVFPDIVDRKPGWAGGWTPGEDVVVTDNHLCLQVPDTIPCIVVHHGCAPAHYQKDPEWRSPMTQAMARDQVLMFNRPKTLWVAPSTWVRDQFAAWSGSAPADCFTVLPHWVPRIERAALRFGMRGGNIMPRVIGDWRNHNKGAAHWRRVAEIMPDVDFRQLDFKGDDDAARQNAYALGDVYLCLSLSEGGPYSVADAEAAGMPIVTTRTGYALDFPGQRILNTREDPAHVADQIRAALAGGRSGPSFYDWYGFATWENNWRHIVARAAAL